MLNLLETPVVCATGQHQMQYRGDTLKRKQHPMSTADLFFALGILDFMRDHLIHLIEARVAREHSKKKEVKTYKRA